MTIYLCTGETCKKTLISGPKCPDCGSEMLEKYSWPKGANSTVPPPASAKKPTSWPPKPTVECEECKVIMPNNEDEVQQCSECGKDMMVGIKKKTGADV
jgi:rRNA maturation endonuclease Nob1